MTQPLTGTSSRLGVRNRIVHGYFGIDDSILFTTIDDDLKPVLPQREALARAHGVQALPG